MKLENLLNSMLRDLWVDLQEPGVVWQLGVIAVCVLLAWGFERALLRWWSGARARLGEARHTTAMDVALEAIGRVLLPFFATGLVAAAQPVLAIWHRTSLLRVGILLLFALALARTIVFVVSRYSRSRTLAAFEKLLVAIVWISVGLHVTGYYDDVVRFLEAIVFVVGKQRVSLWAMLSGGAWMLVTVLVSLWVGGTIEEKLLSTGQGDATVRTVLGRVFHALAVAIGVLIGMSIVGIDVTALSVFGGALGVGLGLGLQRIASSYISGFVVLFERKVRIGDLVTIDKYTGVVREISARFTVLGSGLGWEAIIPNEALLTGTVQNISIDPLQRLSVTITLGYDTDVERAMELLVACAAAHPRVLADPAPAAFLRAFAADGFQVELGYFIRDPMNGRVPVESDVNLAIRRALADAGIVLAPAPRDVRVVGAPGGASEIR